MIKLNGGAHPTLRHSFRRGIGNLEMTAGTKASLPGSGAHDYIDSSA